jgi:hypothetical protein
VGNPESDALMMVSFMSVYDGPVWINPEKVAYVTKYAGEDERSRIVLANKEIVVVVGNIELVKDQLDEGYE